MPLRLQPDKMELCLTFEGGVGDTKTEAAARSENDPRTGERKAWVRSWPVGGVQTAVSPFMGDPCCCRGRKSCCMAPLFAN